jgi:murein DD-endopeptidase MepM/ murein hydrolase activator NlpD
MLAALRLRPGRRPATHAIVAGLVTASALVFPGSSAPAAAEPLPSYHVLAGTVLRPRPPAVVLPVVGYRLTGRFGDRSSLWSSVHTGLDFAAPSGTPIRSIGTGVVVSVGYDGPYGNRTVVRLADGTELWYCHQTTVQVEAGQHVRAGERVGTVGSTGNVTGPHLHLEVRPHGGDPVDPLTWLRRQGLRA